MKEILILKEEIGTIEKASDIFGKIKKIKMDYSQENFVVFYLDSTNKVVKSEILFKGGLNLCIIDCKILFRNALKYNANSILISHNHPSGNLTPSDEDKFIFELLKEAGEILQIKVLDCIIFNKKEFFAMEK